MLGGRHRFPHPSLQHFLFPLQSVSDLHWDPQVKLTKDGMIGHFPDFTLKRSSFSDIFIIENLIF